MNRIGRRILWAAVLLLLLGSCTAKKEALAPPPGPPPSAPPPAPPSPAPPSPARVEVTQLQMTANREFIGVKLRIAGGERIDLDATEIYMIDEATGEKYSVVRLQRIGRLAEFSVPGETGVRHVMFRNHEGKLKVGKRVTVVIGKSRHEHLVIRP